VGNLVALALPTSPGSHKCWLLTIDAARLRKVATFSRLHEFPRSHTQNT
jgi:hypothetical protein